MGRNEIPPREGEQLMISAIELADVVREIASVEIAKAEANADWKDQLKALRTNMYRLARELKQGEG
ncbi:MAG: hypothetical protein EXR86_12380 [Gammaproteobacteria bacterium]|nr:hypothetical protein [Gammaproteobacteria bacterium]